MSELPDPQSGVPRPAIVAQTGIALVHEGEQISAVQGAMATFGTAPNVVQYNFPVEVEIIGDDLITRVFDELRRGFDAIG